MVQLVQYTKSDIRAILRYFVDRFKGIFVHVSDAHNNPYLITLQQCTTAFAIASFKSQAYYRIYQRILLGIVLTKMFAFSC